MKEDKRFTRLAREISGDLYTDTTQRILYATDASAYREIPLAVTRPAGSDDIKKILAFARSEGTSVIPRGAGTSLEDRWWVRVSSLTSRNTLTAYWNSMPRSDG